MSWGVRTEIIKHIIWGLETFSQFYAGRNSA